MLLLLGGMKRPGRDDRETTVTAIPERPTLLDRLLGRDQKPTTFQRLVLQRTYEHATRTSRIYLDLLPPPAFGPEKCLVVIDEYEDGTKRWVRFAEQEAADTWARDDREDLYRAR